MTCCKYYDCGWCYAPEDVKNNSVQGGCFEPEYCATYLMQNKTPMTEKEHLECEIKELRIEIKDNAERIDKLCNILKQNNTKLRTIKEMTNQTPCNHRTPYKPQIEYYDEQMVIVAGVSYTRNEPTPIVIKEDENTIVVAGVKYQKVEGKRTPTIYEFLVQCETGEYDPPDFEKRIEIENYAENFLNYLYECCDAIKEDDKELVVSILKKQMVMPND